MTSGPNTTALQPGPVLVTGAGGFIGRHVVASLSAAGIPVRAMVRRPEQMRPHPGVSYVLADMTDATSLTQAVDGCWGVIHLAAAMRDEADSWSVNVEGARRLIAACQHAGCRRIVNVSTTSVRILRPGRYASTKAEANRLFRDSGLDVTIICPSLVYGSEIDGVFGTLTRVVQRFPVVPVMGNGRWLSAPIHVDDLTDALVAMLRSPGTIGKEYDLGGPDLIPFDVLLDAIGEATGTGARPKLHLPSGIGLLAARVLASVMRNPPFTQSNILGSTQDTGIDIAAARQDIGFAPMSLADGLDKVFADASVRQLHTLRAEARTLTRYLIGLDPDDATIERYVAGHLALLPGPADCVTWVTRRSPATLPWLEAAAALWGTAPGLRKRVLLMNAILEARADGADHFLARSLSPSSACLQLGWSGLRAATRAVIGMPLYLFVRPRT